MTKPRELRIGDRVTLANALAFAKRPFTVDLREGAIEGTIGGEWIVSEILQCPKDCATRYLIREIPDQTYTFERAAVVYREDIRALPRRKENL